MNLKELSRLKEELTTKLFNDIDNLLSEYRFAMKAVENLEKSNLHRRDDEYDY